MRGKCSALRFRQLLSRRFPNHTCLFTCLNSTESHISHHPDPLIDRNTSIDRDIFVLTKISFYLCKNQQQLPKTINSETIELLPSQHNPCHSSADRLIIQSIVHLWLGIVLQGLGPYTKTAPSVNKTPRKNCAKSYFHFTIFLRCKYNFAEVKCLF